MSGQQPMKVMRIVGVSIAVIVGFFMWTFLIQTTQHNPLGVTGPTDYILLFSPIIGFMAPAALNLFQAGRTVSGSCLLALAPLAGILNYALSIWFIVSVVKHPVGLSVVKTVTIAIWLVPMLFLMSRFLLKGAAKLRDASHG